MPGSRATLLTRTLDAPVATVFARTATLDASAGLASSATFLSIFVRQAAIGAVSGIGVSGTFWTTFARQAAIGASADIASANTFFSYLARSAAIGATAQVQGAAIFWTTLLRTAQLNGVGAVAVAGAVAHLYQRLAALSAIGTLAISGVRLDVTPTPAGFHLAATIGTGAGNDPYRPAVADFPHNADFAAILPTPDGEPAPWSLVYTIPSLRCFDEGQIASEALPKVGLDEPLGLDNTQRGFLRDSIQAKCGLSYELSAQITLGELIAQIGTHLTHVPVPPDEIGRG